MSGKLEGRWNFFGTKEGVCFFLDPEVGDFNFFHASLANIFNKCHKKIVFIKKTLDFGYIKYQLEGIEIFVMLKGRWIFFLMCNVGGRCTKFSQPSNGCSLMQCLMMLYLYYRIDNFGQVTR